MKTFQNLKCCSLRALRQAFSLLAVVALLASSVFALQDGAARTPPMGFNTWNYFGCNNINETNVFNVAKAILLKHAANWEGKTLSLADVGYVFINLDDCWHSQRASDGTPQWNTTRFTHGIPWLSDTLHKMGLKMGIYTDCGTQTCAGYFGSYNNETIDANTYVKWNMDYLKEDWCNVASNLMNQAGCASLYSKMGHALVNAANASVNKRRIVFSLCQWGNYNVATWADSCGHLWRTTGDITADWNSMLGNFHNSYNGYGNVGNYKYAKPGAWNDPDMLEVGNGSLTATENQTHFDLWCISAAPLLMGNNTMAMSEATFTILANREVISVDQDSLGVQGRLTRSSGGIEVYAKRLKSIDSVANRKTAVVILNTGSGSASFTLNWADFGETNSAKVYHVRDLQQHKEVNAAATGSYAVTIPGHGTAHLRFANYGTADALVGISYNKISVAQLKEQIKTRSIAGNTEIFVPEPNSMVQVFDVLGKQLSSVKVSDASWYSLNRSVFAHGACLVRVTTSGGVVAEKLNFVK
jgi:alpha-galactosidase